MKSYFKRGLVCGIIFLFLNAGFVSGLNINIKKLGIQSNYYVNTIYVDDDAIPPYDGTIEHPYKYIQDGIDHSSDGDTVFVKKGTYYENVVVGKSINLIGDDRNSTIIDGRKKSAAINTISNGVNISGFTIQNCTSEINAGVYIGSGYNIMINNCSIINNWNGIWKDTYSSTVNVDYCIIKYNQVGVYSNNFYGDLQIQFNIISNNEKFGICLINGNNATVHIINNTIENNTKTGLLLQRAINSADISGNTFRGNGEYGIESWKSDLNLISYNNFIDNSKANAIFINGNNKWKGNYWKPKFLTFLPTNFPEIILGIKYIFNIFPSPWIDFDWTPSPEPLPIKP